MLVVVLFTHCSVIVTLHHRQGLPHYIAVPLHSCTTIILTAPPLLLRIKVHLFIPTDPHIFLLQLLLSTTTLPTIISIIPLFLFVKLLHLNLKQLLHDFQLVLLMLDIVLL